MAGNLPVPQGVELKLVWHVGAEPFALNVLHVKNIGNFVFDQASTNAIDTSVKGSFTTSGLGALFHTGLSLHHVELRSMANASDPWFVGAGAPTPGTGAGNPLPAATSFVVTLKTGLRGRSFNGRVYLAGWTEDANDAAGGITTGGSTAAVNFILAILTLVTNAPYGGQLSVLSRFSTIPPSAIPTERNPPLLTPITAVIARDRRWDVQRRRAIPGI